MRRELDWTRYELDATRLELDATRVERDIAQAAVDDLDFMFDCWKGVKIR